MTTFSILVVDDEREIRDGLKALLENKGYEVETAHDGQEALNLFNENQSALILSDIMMPNMTGTELSKQVKQAYPDTSVVLFTGFSSVESAVEAIKSGADEYLQKPINNEEVMNLVARAYERWELKRDNDMLRQEMLRNKAMRIVGDSPGIKKLNKEIEQAANDEIPVLVSGELGSGKDLVARSIHDQGSRKNQAFVSINCADINADQLERELFGFEKGAFSGAETRKFGLLEIANTGTLILDDISEMSLELQSKLSKTLESKQFRRVGGTDDIYSDFRTISLSQKNLFSLVEGGTFREELFYQLSPYKIDVPSLRSRKSDIPLLVNYFSEKKNRHDPKYDEESDFIKVMQRYDWPGNVRELRHALERVFLLAAEGPLSVDHLPPEIGDISHQFSGGYRGDQERATLADVEREYIAKTLRELGGNKTHAAKALGISLKSLYSKLDELEIKHL